MADKNTLFNRRKQRTRYKIRKHAKGAVRLSVHRSNKHIHAQLIDDVNGKTLASASTLDKELSSKVKKASGVDAAKAVGELIAKRASQAKIKEAVFDRGGYLYHGRVRALAEAAREGGLKI